MKVLADGTLSAGPLGLLVVVVLGIVTVLLIRNMSGRLRRLPREFPPPPGEVTDEGPPAP